MGKRGPKPKRLEKRSGIYCYVNLKNNKKYVGLAIDLANRICQHENNFEKDKFEETNSGESKILWEAVKKYGRNMFYVYTVEFCDIDKLEERESYYIIELKSHVSENGYNILRSGFSRIGILHSDKSKEKMSINRRGEKHFRFNKKSPNSSSSFFGVCINISHKIYVYWRAAVRDNMKKVILGYYKTEVEAAKMYDKYVVEHNLPNALNFPENYRNGVYCA